MSWRLEVNHQTEYHYDRPVVASYNEARVTPLTTNGQVVLDSRLSVRPLADTWAYWDYWGALVHAFDVHDPHDSLAVTSTAQVETAVGSLFGHDEPAMATWEDLAGEEVRDRYYEYLVTSRLVNPHDLASVAQQLRGDCTNPAEAVVAATQWARSQLEYSPGATHVKTSASEAWELGRGVCQDFAHLSLAVLRALGIPARYVSGYFYSKAEGAIGVSVRGESHAWVEAWTGTWQGWDPTNGTSADQRHVLVARGRDYTDVSPLRGIYSGPPGAYTRVTVELTRRA